MKLKMPKLKLPQVKRPSLDISKINTRKFNWTTVLALVGYLNLFALPVYIASRNKPFIHFHAKQGLILFAFFALAVFSFYLPLVPWILFAFYVFGLIWGIVNVVLGRERHIPIIGTLASWI